MIANPERVGHVLTTKCSNWYDVLHLLRKECKTPVAVQYDYDARGWIVSRVLAKEERSEYDHLFKEIEVNE